MQLSSWFYIILVAFTIQISFSQFRKINAKTMTKKKFWIEEKFVEFLKGQGKMNLLFDIQEGNEDALFCIFSDNCYTFYAIFRFWDSIE